MSQRVERHVPRGDAGAPYGSPEDVSAAVDRVAVLVRAFVKTQAAGLAAARRDGSRMAG